MSDLSRLENLEQYFINRKIIEETAAQASKDLGITPFILDFSDSAKTPYHQLHAQLIPVIENLIGENRQKLQQTIYQVDLPEKLFIQALTGPNPAEDLTDVILKRLLQKVVIRRLYSKGQ
jgi:hypothetical protein